MNKQQLQRSAESLAKSGVLEEVAEALRLQSYIQWRATAPGDTAAREQLYFQAKALETVIGSIENLAVPDEA